MSAIENYKKTKDGYRPMLDVHEQFLEAALSGGREIVGPIDDKSLGAIVVARNSGSPLVLMINQKSKGNPWVFPKGHPDEGETDCEGAIREVREETGVDISTALVRDIFCQEAYTFVSDLHNDKWAQHKNFPDKGPRPAAVNHKLVRYYLAVFEAPVPFTIQEEEVNGAEWVSIAEALSRLPSKEGTSTFRAFFDRDDFREQVRMNTALKPLQKGRENLMEMKHVLKETRGAKEYADKKLP